MDSGNYFGEGAGRSPADMLVDKANNLTLTVPEMTVLVGGMRALNANSESSGHGVFTDRPGTLSNDFFVNLLDMSTQWSKSTTAAGIYEGRDRSTGRAPLDSDTGRSRLRFALRTARSFRGLR